MVEVGFVDSSNDALVVGKADEGVCRSTDNHRVLLSDRNE
jgi:hypothetical protein